MNEYLVSFSYWVDEMYEYHIDNAFVTWDKVSRDNIRNFEIMHLPEEVCKIISIIKLDE